MPRALPTPTPHQPPRAPPPPPIGPKQKSNGPSGSSFLCYRDPQPIRAHAHRPTLSTTHPRTSQPGPELPRCCSQRSGNTAGAPEPPQLPEPGLSYSGRGFSACTPSLPRSAPSWTKAPLPGAFTRVLPSPAPAPAASLAPDPPSPRSARGTRCGLTPGAYRSSLLGAEMKPALAPSSPGLADDIPIQTSSRNE